MIYAFFVRNQHRRRIARVIRIVRVTQWMMPTLTVIVGVYVKAWRGHAG